MNTFSLMMGLVMILVILFPVPQSTSAVDTEALRPQDDNYFVYLPWVIKPNPGLQGYVTLDGGPVEGVSLYLWFYDGANWNIKTTTNTKADGSYRFINLPALSVGQAYNVRYANIYDFSRLNSWFTENNTTYNGTEIAQFATFDIANLSLLAPSAGTHITLPNTFTWTKRPATPNDSYALNLVELYNNNVKFMTDPPLGYVNSYTMTQRPPNFQSGVRYLWDVVVHSPEGGYGESNLANVVYFN